MRMRYSGKCVGWRARRPSARPPPAVRPATCLCRRPIARMWSCKSAVPAQPEGWHGPPHRTGLSEASYRVAVRFTTTHTNHSMIRKQFLCVG